jgi:hypothetical protein
MSWGHGSGGSMPALQAQGSGSNLSAAKKKKKKERKGKRNFYSIFFKIIL